MAKREPTSDYRDGFGPRRRFLFPLLPVPDGAPDGVKAAAKLVVGDPTDQETDVGPLITGEEQRRVNDWIGKAVDGGADLLLGGNPLPGQCHEVTVLDAVALGVEQVEADGALHRIGLDVKEIVERVDARAQLIGISNMLTSGPLANYIHVVMGIVFVICVLAFRNGIVGELQKLVKKNFG